MMMTIMTTRPLPNYNQQSMIYQTKIQQLFVAVGMLDEFHRTLISLFVIFQSILLDIQYSIRNTIPLYSELPLLKRIINLQCIYLLASKMEWSYNYSTIWHISNVK
jgi:hypothetical protein